MSIFEILTKFPKDYYTSNRFKKLECDTRNKHMLLISS